MTWHGSGYEYGYEAEQRNIEAARRLRAELGDAETQTRQTFLSLDSQRLRQLLHEYRRLYGPRPYEYCIFALPRWQSGRIKMSGMVAERIFNLLPRFVTPTERQQIAEKLWTHLSPGSDNQLMVSPGASAEQVRDKLDDYAHHHIGSYRFPAGLRARFTWIANRDVELTEKLLNHFQQMEYRVAAEAIRVRLPIIKEKLRALSSGMTATVTEEICVGKHRLKIVFAAPKDKTRRPHVEMLDMNALRERQRTMPPRAGTSTATSEDNYVGCLIWIIVALGILWLMNQ